MLGAHGTDGKLSVGELALGGCGLVFTSLKGSTVLQTCAACLCGTTLQSLRGRLFLLFFLFELKECKSTQATIARPDNVLRPVLLMLRTPPLTGHRHLAAYICLVRQKHPQDHLSPVRRGRRGAAYGS